MSLRKAVFWGGVFWVATISILHAWLNLDLFRPRGKSSHEFRVGFLPVTCHLTCPVTSWVVGRPEVDFRHSTSEREEASPT